MKTSVLQLDGKGLDHFKLPTFQGLPNRVRYGVQVGDHFYEVGIDRREAALSHTQPVEAPRPADPAECVDVVALLFKALLGGGSVSNANCEVPGEAEEWIKRCKATIDMAARAFEERDHWKANHDTQVKLKRIIAERPDLKDRAPKVEKLMAERNRAQARSIRQHARIQELEAIIRGLNAKHDCLPEALESEEDLWRALPDVSEREDGPGEVDPAAGWEAYRRELSETMGPHHLPSWAEASSQLKECYSAGLWAAMEGVAAVGVVQSLRLQVRALEAVLSTDRFPAYGFVSKSRDELVRLRVLPSPDLDIEAGWEEYRQGLITKSYMPDVATWEQLPVAVQESFTAGVRKASNVGGAA